MPEVASGPAVALGIDTFGDVTFGEKGQLLPQADVLRNVLTEAIVADQVGIDAFSVGEHHRADFAVSAPEVVLAAIASRTSRIILGSAVTVLSTDDPVRVFQRFSTLNALSNGRAEVTLGRGSFTESYPLFGFDMAEYDLLFEERVQVFAKLLEGKPFSWEGKTHSPLNNVTAYPPIEPGRKLRTWIGVGGSPESVVRAARYNIPLILAIIGGNPARFKPYADLFRDSLEKAGKPQLPVGAHSPGYVAENDDQAKTDVWPHHLAMISRIGRERGWAPPSREQFERETGADGALYVGSPETVAQKIAKTVRTLGLSRFDMKYSSGTLPHDKLLRSIELFGTHVIPRVRELLS